MEDSFMGLKETAFDFFDACETGKGWAACAPYCQPAASFSAQADALAEVTTVEAYTEWMKGLLVPIPDGHYELLSFGVDEDRQTVTAAAIFHGTHSVDAGNGAPTGKRVAADYAYVMTFKDGKISNMVKIWNDLHSLKQLGWA
jgi:ketosteroid isomerase-like protein